MTVDDELRSLRADVRGLRLTVYALAAGIVMIAASDPSYEVSDAVRDDAKRSSLVLTSPNGKHAIAFHATDKGAGIWVTPMGNVDGPSVSITEGLDDKGVGRIGIFGSGPSRDGYDYAAFADADGGHTQLIRRGHNEDGTTYKRLFRERPQGNGVPIGE